MISTYGSIKAGSSFYL